MKAAVAAITVDAAAGFLMINTVLMEKHYGDPRPPSK
jgi:hypothetical protein